MTPPLGQDTRRQVLQTKVHFSRVPGLCLLSTSCLSLEVGSPTSHSGSRGGGVGSNHGPVGDEVTEVTALRVMKYHESDEIKPYRVEQEGIRIPRGYPVSQK